MRACKEFYGSVPGVDPDLAYRFHESDTDFYGELLVIFHDTYREISDHLHDSVAAGDRATARLLAHKLKGVAGNLCLPRLREHAHNLESALNGAEERELAAKLAEIDRILAPLFARIEDLRKTTPCPHASLLNAARQARS